MRLDYQGTAIEQERQDSAMQQLLQLELSQVEPYVRSKVTNLSRAQDILIVYGKAILLLAREIDALKKK